MDDHHHWFSGGLRCPLDDVEKLAFRAYFTTLVGIAGALLASLLMNYFGIGLSGNMMHSGDCGR